MKAGEAHKLIESCVRAQFPWLARVGEAAVAIEDHGRIARGFHLDRSQMHPRIARLRVFGQALFIPDTAVSFGVSRDLGSFDFDDPDACTRVGAAAASGAPFLEGEVATVRSLAVSVERFIGISIDGDLACEIQTYGMIYSAQVGGAVAGLKRLVALAESSKTYKRDIAARAAQVTHALRESVRAATDLLDQWAAETREAIGLSDPSLATPKHRS